MNMVPLCQVHHLYTVMVTENPLIVYKSTPMDSNPAYPIK